MREVNFSIPNVNKAAVNITTTLYDRRALDCTSTLPLINSLNHLAYLTTSSARIRDILTVDGGIEQLVCILKEGRSKDLMEMWKWNLAFQCVVNIGVRGTENVRTRVVEADIVPVVATILDNYIRVVDKIRARADAEAQRNCSRTNKPSSRSHNQGNRSSFFDRAPTTSDHRTTRRQAPPPSIEIPHPYSQDSQPGESGAMEITPSPQLVLTSPPERTTFPRDGRSHRTHEGRLQPGTHRHRIMQPLATALPPVDGTDGFGMRPVRDADRLPSMVPGLQPGLNSQPDSPTTPHAVPDNQNPASLTARARRRPSIRQQPSGSGESDDTNGDDVAMGEDPSPHPVAEPIVDVQNGMEIDNVGESGSMLDGSSDTHAITIPNPSDTPEAETFNITHPSAIDVSIINTTTQPGNGGTGLSPARPTTITTASPVIQQTPYPFYLRDRQVAPNVLTAMPRDEDVLMALQLLAYVSKYCNLRSYFQKSHLVPKLKLGKDIHLLDDATGQPHTPLEQEEEEEEYLLPDDFNIFPLVEKFTIRHHTKDMQYWACVVMRNLCRKDDARGGIRQCAYYKCGKWEEFQRQFAKCRRCRRTKYCSKECQKNAWAFHRHWCHITPGPSEQAH
ncbi:MYND domain protein (SamB) [Paracoccidioides lutzii Pb01]|uniref:MYND-type zinc finger protein samB n=1 Tax=Paracoccidioides lutzii (strain ATCC MYA-826 / Pb01) TaxID=502779 RepID=C1GV05_PARBA|nr:MYND domain protein (SamB) [Paracoccidioides lutzii Pb01]EEH40423.2 MYND domain protein (SamB) [Paracoccidioides lutzii Pb01]